MPWYELTRWLAYRKIQHSQIHIYTRTLPIGVALILCATFYFFPVKPNLFGQSGLTTVVFEIVALLPGFYVAALAAVSTFNGIRMDEVMPKPAPKLSFRMDGELIVFDLTRRLFLSYLFSYLAVLSLFMVVLLGIANFIAPSIVYVLNDISTGAIAGYVKEILIYSFLFLVGFMFSSIVFTTLHGVYFMTEKMNQPN